MEEEDISERRLKLASLMNRVKSLKTKYQNEENLSEDVNYSGLPADITDHSASISHLMMMGNDPADWWSFLLQAEKKGDPRVDHNLLVKLTDVYNRAVSVLPAEEHSSNESYAKILVRFAELKSFSSEDEARDQFQIARLNCKMFAFVHIAFAQFELSQGNLKKSKQILQKAVECRAFPKESLNIAMQNLNLKKMPLLSDSNEDKENVAVQPLPCSQESNHHAVENSRVRKQSDCSENIYANVNSSSPEDFDVEQKFFQQLPNQVCLFGKVPVETVNSGTTPNIKNNDVANINTRQHYGSTCRSALETSTTMQKPDGDDDSYNLGNVKFGKVPFNIKSKYSAQDNVDAANDSTVTLLNKTESSTTVKNREPEKMDQGPNTFESFQEQNRLQDPASLAVPGNSSLCPGQAKMNPDGIAWKVPEGVCHRSALEGKINGFESSCAKRSTPAESVVQQSCSVQKRTTPPETASRRHGPAFLCATPGNLTQNDYMSCFRTPVVNGCIQSISQNCTPYSRPPSYQQSKLQTPASSFQNHGNFQVSTPQTTNECTLIKGRVYTILRQIGTGGSSKVFQVIDEKKRLFAVKYVNLEEADQKTVESYKNEIDYLIKLQPHSDKIIRLYDYEITDHQIRVVMECGNIDLNSWLRKKKTISPWERKSYWKNMLEAVHAIHQHGIVHSDLKPANFLIVDGMLKLIDFGIANQMQPDMTSIVKDSQVGTVNYMPPEAIKDLSSKEENGKTRTKISPKSDVWSLGCILYYMTYGKTPFQHITNQITKLHAIIDASYEIEFPPIPEMDLQDVLKKCLVRNPKWRISIAELLVHPYVQIQPLEDQKMNRETSGELKRILGQILCLNSPNSISRAARTLYEQCDSGQSLNVAALTNSVQKPWTMK